MSMERLKILEKLSAGEIDAAEAAALLAEAKAQAATVAVDKTEAEIIVVETPAKETVFEKATKVASEPPISPKAPEQPLAQAVKSRFLRIHVSAAGGEDKVRINIPLNLLRFGLQIGDCFRPEVSGKLSADFDALVNDFSGKPLVKMSGGDEKIVIFVE